MSNQEWRGTATRYAGNAASSLAICQIHALTAPSVYRRLEALCRRRRICHLAAHALIKPASAAASIASRHSVGSSPVEAWPRRPGTATMPALRRASHPAGLTAGRCCLASSAGGFGHGDASARYGGGGVQYQIRCRPEAGAGGSNGATSPSSHSQRPTLKSP